MGTLPAEVHFITKRGKWLGVKSVEKWGKIEVAMTLWRRSAAILFRALIRQRLEIAAAFHGFHHGDFVGVFEVGAHWNADTDAGDPDAQRFKQF